MYLHSLIKLDEPDEKDERLLKLNDILSNNVFFFCLFKELVRLIRCGGKRRKKEQKTKKTLEVFKIQADGFMSKIAFAASSLSCVHLQSWRRQSGGHESSPVRSSRSDIFSEWVLRS